MLFLKLYFSLLPFRNLGLKYRTFHLSAILLNLVNIIKLRDLKLSYQLWSKDSHLGNCLRNQDKRSYLLPSCLSHMPTPNPYRASKHGGKITHQSTHLHLTSGIERKDFILVPHLFREFNNYIYTFNAF